MPSLGPELPLPLRQRLEVETVAAGPEIPPEPLKQQTAGDDDEDEDDYVPELPPDIKAARSVASSVPAAVRTSSHEEKRISGPSLPSYPPIYDPKYHSAYNEDDEDDDDFGPKPLPAGVKHAERDAVQEFLEREERMRKVAEEAEKPKALKRDEWMLVPPSSSDLLGNLDPTKLKARQFSRSTGPISNKTDNSLWTETPSERQQRLADEVSGKRRRAVDNQADADVDDSKRRRMDDEIIRKGVEDYTQKLRGPSLLAQHEASGKSDTKEKDDRIWDHSRDMSIGGRLMDESKRTKLIHEAHGLGDRFGTGKSGGFL
ncbi:hypothetical protein C0989_009332 [Termitomyces sp. Mn162]|nr:hypothetical protein C0989_009332 [Termitomyces sp. Mn162]